MNTGRWSLLLDASDWLDIQPQPLQPLRDLLAVPVGEHPAGVACWDLQRSPHLLVAGATGSGKSSFLRGLIANLPVGWSWRVIVIDPKEVDFAAARNELVVSGLPDAPGMVADLAESLAERKKELIREGVEHWSALGERIVPWRLILLVIDEATDVFAGTGLSREPAAQLRSDLAVIIRQGRACGIHTVVSFTRPDAEFLPGALRDQFGARVALGSLSRDGARMMFGNRSIPTLLDAPPGTGLSLGLDGSPALGRLRVPYVTLEEARHRFRPWGF